MSEGLKPIIPGVITFGAGHFYISQSDKGGLVFGGDIDGYNSYAQRGNLPVVEDVCVAPGRLAPEKTGAALTRSAAPKRNRRIRLVIAYSSFVHRSQIRSSYEACV